MSANSDRIEKKVVLKAPRERVWQAISDARQFGAWFGMRLDGQFEAGRLIKGRISPTKVDPEVAKMQEAFDGAPCDLLVETIEPMRRFAFRWHPYPLDESPGDESPGDSQDFIAEPTTLVTFELEEVPQGTHLTITESGFDRLPAERRARAFADNSEGWQIQTTLIGKYLAQAA